MKSKFKYFLGVSALALVSGCSVINVTEEVCTVTGKESIVLEGNHQYRVYTTCGTYKMEDQLLQLNFNTADLYGMLEINSKYKITSSGYRVPIMSIFKSINKVEKL